MLKEKKQEFVQRHLYGVQETEQIRLNTLEVFL